jgi:tripartite-type tricarboxylate transporter receptor subunit TctC
MALESQLRAKRVTAHAILVLVVLLGGAAGHAQTYPGKPIRIIIPYAPGGGQDVLARALANGLSERLGQPVIVENRGGANTIIGTEFVATSPADGYTLLLCSGALVINPSLYKTSYDAAKSFTPISQMLGGSLMLVVHPSIPAQNVRELVAFAKTKPGQLSYSSYGTGSPSHLAGELLESMTSIEMLHVPFKGSTPAITEVVSGRVSMSFAVMSPVLPFVRSGRVRAIGVASAERMAGYKEFPTLAESGLPGFDVAGWNGLCGPAGLFREVVGRLYASIVDYFAVEEVRKNLTNIGLNVLPRPTSPEEFATRILADIEKFGKLVKRAGIKPE